MNKFSSGRELPEYVFAEKFDSFMWFDFTSLMKYIYDGLFIKSLKKAVSDSENNSKIFINIFSKEGDTEFLWYGLPICEVKLNLQLPIEGDWHKSNQLNEQEKNALDYFMWTHPQYYVYDKTQNWAIYCDRLAEICILGMKNDLIPYFKVLKESDELLRFSSVEDYFCKRDFIFKKEIIPWAIAEMKKNYPNIIS